MTSQHELQQPGEFDSAYKQLRDLVKEMESGNLSLDELVDRVQQARALLNFCHDRLRSVKAGIAESLPDPEQP